MFTGLVETVGRIIDSMPSGGDRRLRIGWGTLPTADIAIGDSISVSGCCLTVVEFDAAGFSADLSVETLQRTTLGKLEVGAAVNLERAMLPTTRFGGHMVAGHVDGIGRVLAIRDDGRGQHWRFAMPPALLRYVVEKGSICVDGVSLTVNAVDGEGFEVMLIPHTLANTTLGAYRADSPVNLEVDLIARYVERLLPTRETSADR